MEFSFKNLPKSLFSKPGQKKSTPSILWLPPLQQHPIVEEIDWLSGLQISNIQFSKGKMWSDGLRKIITDLELPLDETSNFKNSNTFVFSLPNGFKSSIGMILFESDWSNQSDVYEKYMNASEDLKKSFSIQSLCPWSSTELSGVEWIKI